MSHSSRVFIDSPITLRKSRGVTKRGFDTVQDPNIVFEKNKVIGELLNLFDEKMRLREPNIPEVIFPYNLDDIEIEAEAVKLREFWGLGLRGISNITHLLENNGIMCLRQSCPLKIDAFSCTLRLNNIRQSIICLNNEKNFYRQRFNLCHELAHLVLHSCCDQLEFEENRKRFDSQANLFASAFLMPANTFLKSIFSFYLESLKEMKKEWGVSIFEMLQRLHTLKIINESVLYSRKIELAQKGWHRVEPYDKETPLEKPYLMDYYLGIYFDNICSKEELLCKLVLDEEVAYELTGSEFFKGSQLEKNIIPFSLVEEEK